jgi:hypothetical protein
MKTGSTIACALTLGAAFLLPSVVHAQVLCDDLTNLPNKVYGVGGSAVTATLKRISLAIEKDAGKTAERTTILYHDDLGACAGFEAFKAGKVDGKFRYWISNAANDADQRCDAAPGGQAVQFSHMGNDAEFCPQGSIPAGVGDFPAPVQTLNLIADAKSNQEVISAEALFFVYGYGPTGQAAPWTEGTGVFKRQPDSFAALLLAAAIDVPATAVKWDDATQLKATQGDVISAITTYGSTETLARQTLGYVSGSAADRGRTAAKPVKTLAYQHFDQTCGVYPDSDPAKFDKINVRLGKYFLWAPGHYYTNVDAQGKPTNALVENLLGWFSKKTSALGTSVNAFEQSILAGDIPQCAMQVSREGTLGAISSYADPKPCGCYFEQLTNPAVTSTCTPCTSDAQCGDAEAPSCNFGFCEAYRDAGEEEG